MKKKSKKQTNNNKSEYYARKNSAETSFEDEADLIDIRRERSYFSFLVRSIKRSASYRAYKRVNSFFRPFFFIARFLRILFNIFAFIQASALLLLLAAALILLLPALLLILFFLLLFIRIDENLKYKKERAFFEKKDVIILFRRKDFSPFYFENLKELSKRYMVLVVIPYPIRLLSRRRVLFLNSFSPYKNVIISYEWHYFTMRHEHFKNAKSVVELI